ncbi:recombinase family protein [Neobacillus sp. PS3-40]|uniref:recombinase family protein n=1 Tax=Neobacillus sp. PS3-40 TaxID=3070679 RepID=UPI0027DEF31B|nr:recombinase family protein [Neobacillus sp. PS3-40]WML46171.1 recombinase family protein [Neobacillus sp. PS3-40]
MNNYKIAVGYCRSSGMINPKSSIPNQIYSIKQYCEKNNIYLKKIYIDECKSGTKIKGRFQYVMLKEEIEKDNNIEMVIVAFSDRLARDSYEFIITLEEFSRKGVEFISVSENLCGTNMTPLQTVMIGIQSEMENKQRYKRINDSKLSKMHQGKYMFRDAPFGYIFNKERFLIEDKKSSPIVKHIFQKCIEGFPPGKIVKIIKEVFQHTINQRSLSGILTNKTYTGYIFKKLKSEEGKITYEQLSFVPHQNLVSLEQFERVNSIINNNSKIKRTRNFYLLSNGILLCSNCSGKMKGLKKGIYKCNTCNIQYPIEMVHQKVFELLMGKEMDLNQKNSYSNVSTHYERTLEKKQKLEKAFARAEITLKAFKSKLEQIQIEIKILHNSNEMKIKVDYSELIQKSQYRLLYQKLKNDNIQFEITEDGKISSKTI